MATWGLKPGTSRSRVGRSTSRLPQPPGMFVNMFSHRQLSTLEPRCEKTGFLQMRKQRCRYREADQRLCFRYSDSRISLLPKSEISSLQPSSVAVQPGLCGTWSDTPKTGFLRTRLIVSVCKSEQASTSA